MISMREVTLTLDTLIYAANDVLAAPQRIEGFFNQDGNGGVIRGITLLDQDNQGVAVDIVLSSRNITLGTENAAVTVSDAEAVYIQTNYSIAAADFAALVNSKVACKTGLFIPVKAEAGSNDMWIGAVVRSGTPTFTASGIVVKLFVEE